MQVAYSGFAAFLGWLILAMEGQMLAPRREQHDLREPVFRIGPDAPGGAAGRVVLLLLGVGRIDRDDDEVEFGELSLLRPIMGRHVALPIFTLEDAALPRRRALLVLAGKGILAQLVFHLLDGGLAEAVGPRQLAVVPGQLPGRHDVAILVQGPGVDPADVVALERLPGFRIFGALAIGARRVPEWLEVHRDHAVAVVALTRQDVARHIVLMQPL